MNSQVRGVMFIKSQDSALVEYMNTKLKEPMSALT